MDYSLIVMDCLEMEMQSPTKCNIQILGDEGPFTFKMHGVHLPYGISRNKKGKPIMTIRFDDDAKYYSHRAFFEKLDEKICERFDGCRYCPILQNNVVNPVVSTNYKGQSNLIIKNFDGERVMASDLPYNCVADVTLCIPYIWILPSSNTKENSADVVGAYFVIKQVDKFFSSRSNNNQ